MRLKIPMKKNKTFKSTTCVDLQNISQISNESWAFSDRALKNKEVVFRKQRFDRDGSGALLVLKRDFRQLSFVLLSIYLSVYPAISMPIVSASSFPWSLLPSGLFLFDSLFLSRYQAFSYGLTVV